MGKAAEPEGLQQKSPEIIWMSGIFQFGAVIHEETIF